MKLMKTLLVALALTGSAAYAQSCEQAIESEDSAAANICEKELASSNDANLQYLTGFAYDKKEDFENAAKFYAKAAEQGHAKSQYNLATMYSDGQGVARDEKKAAEWYTKAAEQGHPEAQFNLAVMYRKGYGVAKDKAIAKEWFGKACDNGIHEGCSRR
ncbi:tetratricopeptide repeat protein [Moraxella nasicaprae]|uniref:Sel1 repeat family protein n=1 Tax=Moraxella nasicaprae TaxID=2904122 RepID=A0ABY6F3S2_9GAMM|nr:tetratricopeptide repeat protein [Moraxella nasicaprae]UXZ04738.1 sel1 repeat family protein [Moraxella nasicaprae]